MSPILKSLKQIVIVMVALVLCTGCARGFLPSLDYNPWELVSLPTDVTLSDIAFTGDRNHGWLVGKDSTLLETFDGGKSWELRRLDLEDELPYTFTSVSFSGEEGWVAGQPSILLHTLDGGQSWSRVPLSEQLPGSPSTVVALAPKKAEMTTNIGAIYQTADGGKTWQALVQEAVGVVRTIARSPKGGYVAVSSRGNFYSTWLPGQAAWEQHNRTSSRRLQSMGFSPDGDLWLLARGGSLQLSAPGSLDQWQDSVTPEFATSWGLLDLAYRTPNEIWVAGGSANLLRSEDGGQTWQKDKAVEDVPSNFYKVVFISPEQGFVLGQGGTLLRYQPSEKVAFDSETVDS
ncbi:photosynthesis system II assembly factor Ycf48 [Oscillatoria sp. FACHB-1407]|uniref:photosynthesis system II assembly factor Ycf48 n=1 Tax=Oscillatoria sp. FACHB-1407 TaxID=2692847 RepID=UPI001682BF3F|nr:photosynthesis system II assembly factor Ycf48 [Oscillatoria sp. FACHB-1407]MBD2461970.1 photosynthesis system II assembly factor Ycf48 [Oscillatoria sp. FACHB-1407]